MRQSDIVDCLRKVVEGVRAGKVPATELERADQIFAQHEVDLQNHREKFRRHASAGGHPRRDTRDLFYPEQITSERVPYFPCTPRRAAR